jgi:hypothetical protein
MAKLNTIDNLTALNNISTQSNILDNLTIVPNAALAEQGFYPPSFTNEQMLAFTPSSNAVIIFNTDTQTFMTYQDGEWVAFIDTITNIVTIPSSDVDPVSPVEGQIYCNATTNQLKLFLRGQWSIIPRIIVA